MSRWMMPQPVLGDDVWWFNNADKNTQPVAAKVTDVGRDGVHLVLFRKLSGTIEPKRGCHHVDDPTINETEKRPDWATFNGGWDFRDGDPRKGLSLVPASFVEMPAAPPAPIVPDFEEEMLVLEWRYRKDLRRPDYIAKKICGGWTADVVTAILARYTKEEALGMLEEWKPEPKPEAEVV